MERAALRDHITALLNFIVRDLETYQSVQESVDKSKGLGPDATASDSPGESHAEQRFTGGFDTVEMISEFRALRSSIIRLWAPAARKGEKHSAEDFADLIRFNESIDQVMTESLVRYTEKITAARTLFLGTLMHDLRNPLNAVLASAQRLLRANNLDNRQTQLVSQIETSTGHIGDLVSFLIDEVRIRLHRGLPLSPAPMNMEEAVHAAVREIRAAYPQRTISLVTSGNLEVEWDYTRIAQLLSNLIGNAIHHGPPDDNISVTAKGIPGHVILTFHNNGIPIPAALLPRIFDPLTRGPLTANKQAGSPSLGLGLFITRGIVEAHHGTIEVTSDAANGTLFTVQMPRIVRATPIDPFVPRLLS